MKAVYDDLWLEIVYRKPPWSLLDVLHCLKKHWIAVFGHLVPRPKQQNVLNLIEFFNSGKAVDQNSTSHFCRQQILNTLQPQGETSTNDVVMKEAEEDQPPTSLHISHSEVWALFENIWDHVCQTSLKVFKALDFDPGACPSVLPPGGPPPPRDVLLCLEQLLCTVSQLLQAFSSVLTCPGLAESQNLLSLMQSIQASVHTIVDADKLTATDLLNCFSQQEYGLGRDEPDEKAPPEESSAPGAESPTAKGHSPIGRYRACFSSVTAPLT
ncbi:hypothetical protein WMY93_024851 [Mugilogobius chulae]|uniref:Uncharacterized protein n=1 Tax=Mugilogobius chulae TaxID=88201 RepID=A0AAW0N7K3_9GOBI